MTNQEFIESVSLPNEEWRDVVGYDTMCEATKHGYSQSMISECCNGNRKHHRGMRWLRYSDYEKLTNMSKNS